MQEHRSLRDKKHIFMANRKMWRAWLSRHHHTENGVWVVFEKGKNRRLSYNDLVEEALCFGWIDSLPGKVSDTQSKLYFSKRKEKSVWSKANKTRIEKLCKAGLVDASGLAVLIAAKNNGSYDALNNSDSLIEPPELSFSLDSNPTARKHFNNFSESVRKNILAWIYDAKTNSTRQKRIIITTRMAMQNLRAKYDKEIELSDSEKQ